MAALAKYASPQHRRYANPEYVWNLARVHGINVSRGSPGLPGVPDRRLALSCGPVEGLVETPHGRIYVEREGDPSGGASSCFAADGPGTSHDHYHPWFSRLADTLLVVYFDYSGCGHSVPARR